MTVELLRFASVHYLLCCFYASMHVLTDRATTLQTNETVSVVYVILNALIYMIRIVDHN